MYTYKKLHICIANSKYIQYITLYICIPLIGLIGFNCRKQLGLTNKHETHGLSIYLWTKLNIYQIKLSIYTPTENIGHPFKY